MASKVILYFVSIYKCKSFLIYFSKEQIVSNNCSLLDYLNFEVQNPNDSFKSKETYKSIPPKKKETGDFFIIKAKAYWYYYIAQTTFLIQNV